MSKKSRVIVNNWSSLSDYDAVRMASYTVEDGVNDQGEYPTRRYKLDGRYYLVAAFRGKASHSFDIRDCN